MKDTYTNWKTDELLPSVYILRRDVKLAIGNIAMVSITDGKAILFRHPTIEKPFQYVTMMDYIEDPIELALREVNMQSRTLFYYDNERRTVVKTKAAERLLNEDDALDIFMTLSQCYENEDQS